MLGLRGIILIAALVLPGAGVMAQAPITCPQEVAKLGSGAVADQINVRLAGIYRALHCNTLFTALPGQRGIQLFNQHQLDGEVFRMTMVEDHYNRAFVRSAAPVGMVTNALWYRQGHKPAPDWGHVGYIRGIVWQENLVKGKDSRALTDHTAMLKAYNDGKIHGMLLSLATLEGFHRTGALADLPDMVGEPLMQRPMYHYLGAEFTAFMRHFDQAYASMQASTAP